MQPDCRTSAAWSRRARRAPASRTPPWRARWAWASCLAASGSLRPLLLRVRDHAAAGAAVECIAPQRLNWVRRAAAEGHVLRSALAGADPRAFVSILGPAPSTQPVLGNGSVMVSAYSCPPTIENPPK